MRSENGRELAVEPVVNKAVPKPASVPAAKTDCATEPLLFQDLARRQVLADFSGGYLSSDGGTLLLRQIDRGLGVSRSIAACFCDARDPRRIDHQLEELVAQRLHAEALGYEDLNDHDTLRRDPLLAVSVGKADPLGLDRWQDRGTALAAPSTLNRLELSNHRRSRYHKLSHDPRKLEATLLKVATRCLRRDRKQIVLDLDAMGHLVHGLQEGRHFSAYYDGYCYQPLYVVCGSVVLWAQLRVGDTDPKEDVLRALATILPVIRRRCPRARILVRGDSGFCREELMAFCEAEAIDYVLGLPKNAVLNRKIEAHLAMAAARQCLCGGVNVREYTEFDYQTQKSWSRSRRVVAKAEVTAQGNNPRYVVTSVSSEERAAQSLYEDLYCERGNMENVLKQQTLDLRADRLSTHHLGSNQLRLWWAAFAYLLMERLRALTLQGTELAEATVGTIRTRLLKVAAAVRVSVRRVYVQLSSAFPMQAVFRRCAQRLAGLKYEAG